jgi:hypothetical protein
MDTMTGAIQLFLLVSVACGLALVFLPGEHSECGSLRTWLVGPPESLGHLTWPVYWLHRLRLRFQSWWLRLGRRLKPKPLPQSYELPSHVHIFDPDAWGWPMAGVAEDYAYLMAKAATLTTEGARGIHDEVWVSDDEA